jgi:large subunit ribosomal protein L15
MPLQRRLPKRGFNNIFKKSFHVVNLQAFKDSAQGSLIDRDALRAMGLIKGKDLPIRLLAKGDLASSLSFEVQYASKAAVEKVEAKGGKVSLVSFKQRKGPRARLPRGFSEAPADADSGKASPAPGDASEGQE